jgi:hypothetical protein
MAWGLSRGALTQNVDAQVLHLSNGSQDPAFRADVASPRPKYPDRNPDLTEISYGLRS